METSLHRQLKLHYAASEGDTEIVVGSFRIDAVAPCGELIEIQYASLGALRDKTRKLLEDPTRSLRIVKPILARKRLVTLTQRGGKVKRTRMSPKRGDLLDVFEDLVHFSNVFPCANLTLEVVLIESEETRVDRSRPTRRGKRFRVIDQRLCEVGLSVQLRTAADLLTLIPTQMLPATFDTAELAAALERPRWLAQKVAYCLRMTGATVLDGKRGNSQLYRVATPQLKVA
jgi:hypothetical protein